MEKIVGEDRIYASRSELIREAVRLFIQKSLTSLENANIKEKQIIPKTSNCITGNFRISKQDPNLIFIIGFGLVKKVEENPNLK